MDKFITLLESILFYVSGYPRTYFYLLTSPSKIIKDNDKRICPPTVFLIISFFIYYISCVANLTAIKINIESMIILYFIYVSILITIQWEVITRIFVKKTISIKYQEIKILFYPPGIWLTYSAIYLFITISPNLILVLIGASLYLWSLFLLIRSNFSLSNLISFATTITAFAVSNLVALCFFLFINRYPAIRDLIFK